MNIHDTWSGIARTAVVFGCLVCLNGMAGATTVNDGPGGFIPTFTGTQTGDIDILTASLTRSGSNLLFSATMNGTIGNAADTYVLGINRGLSTRNFSAVGLGGVTFDSVLTVTGAAVQGGTESPGRHRYGASLAALRFEPDLLTCAKVHRSLSRLRRPC